MLLLLVLKHYILISLLIFSIIILKMDQCLIKWGSDKTQTDNNKIVVAEIKLRQLPASSKS